MKRERIGRPALFGGGVYLFLYAPLLLVVAYSFNDSRLDAEWTGSTLRWYGVLARDLAMQRAAWNSLMIAMGATVCASTLGTLTAFAMYRYRPRALTALVIAPVAIPEVLMGVSLLLFFVSIDLELGLLTVVLSHITLCVGFVAVVVRSHLEGLDDNLIDTVYDLGATPLQAIWYMVLPLILPRMAAGALLAFTLSMDGFVVTLFTSGPRQPTLPIQIYSMIRVAAAPEVNAVSSTLMLIALATSLVAFRMSRDVWRVHVRSPGRSAESSRRLACWSLVSRPRCCPVTLRSKRERWPN